MGAVYSKRTVFIFHSISALDIASHCLYIREGFENSQFLRLFLDYMCLLPSRHQETNYTPTTGVMGFVAGGNRMLCVMRCWRGQGKREVGYECNMECINN